MISPERAEELLGRVAGLRVVVVGDLMIDRYVSGSVDRVSPEAPVPVVRVEEERAAIGGAGNVAANIAALGASCAVVGCVGEDDYGATLTDAFERREISVEGIVRAHDRPTSVKTRVMARHQQIVRFDHEVETDVPVATAEALAERIESLGADADLVVMEDYNKGVLVPPVIAAALAVAARREIPTIVDPKRRNFFGYGGVDVFKPNAKELADALGAFIHPDDPDWMEETRNRLGCTHLLLTLGERGMALQSESTGHLQVPTVARSVYDVSGAGDTVTAMVGAVLAAGGTAAEAAVMATHAAALEVSKAGVATVSPEEILRHVREVGAERARA